MTEQEWITCTDPNAMLSFLRGKASDRKLRLFACSCYIIAWNFIADDRNSRVVELAECLADGVTDRKNEVVKARASAANSTAWCTIIDSAWDAAFHAARHGAGDVARSAIRGKIWGRKENRDNAWWQARAAARLTQVSMVRDIFGNPFHLQLSVDSSWLAWNDGTVWKLAQAIYDDRAFDRLPILADALEEAGCDNADILNHCRQSGEHVRGCWVIDLLLGKS